MNKTIAPTTVPTTLISIVHLPQHLYYPLLMYKNTIGVGGNHNHQNRRV